jgi:hypothetical protein
VSRLRARLQRAVAWMRRASRLLTRHNAPYVKAGLTAWLEEESRV